LFATSHAIKGAICAKETSYMSPSQLCLKTSRNLFESNFFIPYKVLEQELAATQKIKETAAIHCFPLRLEQLDIL
jgi:hypothetical protein